MTKQKYFVGRAKTALLHALVFLLIACTNTKTATLPPSLESIRVNHPEEWAEMQRRSELREAQRTEVQGVSISCYNHGDYRGTGFAVEEVAHGQLYRGMVGGPFGCGGDLALSYPLPLKWRPGLKVRVTWRTYAPGATEPTRHEKSTTIRPYDRLGTVYVHFYPGDQVRIVVSDYYGVGHPLHPLAEDDLIPPPEID